MTDTPPPDVVPDVDPSQDWIHVTHPDIPLPPEVEPGYCTRQALEEVWAEKGWVETEWSPPPEPEAEPEVVPETAPEGGAA